MILSHWSWLSLLVGKAFQRNSCHNIGQITCPFDLKITLLNDWQFRSKFEIYSDSFYPENSRNYQRLYSSYYAFQGFCREECKNQMEGRCFWINVCLWDLLGYLLLKKHFWYNLSTVFKLKIIWNSPDNVSTNNNLLWNFLFEDW